MRWANFLYRDTSGAAAAEMALIIPLALALIFTTFEGAYYMICEHRVVKGVRDASRYAARLDLTHFSCPSSYVESPTGVPTVTLASIKDLTRTGKLTGGTVTVPGWGTDSNDVTIAVTCLSGQRGIYDATGGNAPRVSVSTRVVYPSLMGSMGFTAATIYIGAAAQSPVIGL